jgi:hypothetical protein
MRQSAEACRSNFIYVITRYALERTHDFIKVWFWSRNNKSVPDDVKNGASSVETDGWVCNHPSRGEHTSKLTES